MLLQLLNIKTQNTEAKYDNFNMTFEHELYNVLRIVDY